ncbi:lactonase family protein [Actinoplanes sp. TBRC 11911]|uniref:lactonase family protein n=1 Tax=Actinoplanes sp. TBRC 11911 TaxID=2729386 RepID=UPI00145CB98C|nr:hypothetical protein [Actinoplanes sp. TBRC 11911]NMO50533.1 lactonase family protein [Actinoplanes sp. TBRC 11911]
MRHGVRAAAVAGAVLVGAGVLGAPAYASGGSHGGVFAQANGLGGNSVVAYDSGLHRVGVYATGGRGGLETGAAVDPLASQGSLTLDRGHGLLYAVNAGSDTITVFGVRGTRLERLQVIGSGGAFPVSVTVHGNLVYVLNAREGGSIQGFRRDGNRLVREAGWHRALGLDPTATPEFTHTPGEVAFTPDGRQLLVTTKGNTNEILAYAVSAAHGPATKPVRNAEGTTGPFALAFDGSRQVVVSESGPNAAATFGLARNGRLDAKTAAATGGQATCWVIGVNGTFYLANAGSATITAFGTGPGGSLRKLSTTATAGAGSIDLSASSDGSVLYAQTGGGTDAVQAFRIGHDGKLTSIGSATIPGGANSEGLAAF